MTICPVHDLVIAPLADSFAHQGSASNPAGFCMQNFAGVAAVLQHRDLRLLPNPQQPRKVFRWRSFTYGDGEQGAGKSTTQDMYIDDFNSEIATKRKHLLQKTKKSLHQRKNSASGMGARIADGGYLWWASAEPKTVLHPPWFKTGTFPENKFPDFADILECQNGGRYVADLKNQQEQVQVSPTNVNVTFFGQPQIVHQCFAQCFLPDTYVVGLGLEGRFWLST